MSGKLCICIPTKDRPEMVENVMKNALPVYEAFGISLIYYDSSEDDRTRQVIEAARDRRYPDIYYERMPSSLCLDEKTFRIFKNSDIIREYQYIWLVNDSISIRREALERVCGLLNCGYDLIRLHPEGDGSREDYISSDVNEWFHYASRGIAHMASTIMSRSLLEAAPDWDGLYRKYVVTSDMHDSAHQFFFTTGLYLEQIAKLPHFKGILLGNTMKWRRDSYLKKGRSYWNHIPFEVWARSYPSTILALPDCYTEKERVVRESDNIMHGRFERQSMIAYRIQGLLTREVAEKYRMYWPYVSTLSFEEICEIADMPVETLVLQYGTDYGDLGSWERILEAIERELGDDAIIIYGAGLYGEYVLEKLVDDGFGDRIAGVAVSDPYKNVDEIDGFPVRVIDEFFPIKDRATVIISTLPDTGRKIWEHIKPMGFEKVKMIF